MRKNLGAKAKPSGLFQRLHRKKKLTLAFLLPPSDRCSGSAFRFLDVVSMFVNAAVAGLRKLWAGGGFEVEKRREI